MRTTVILLAALSLFACASKQPAKLNTRDYVTVGKMMDSIKPPYVVDARGGDKRVVLVGCDHNRDPQHPQFATLQKYFQKLQPQVAFNEGGPIADTVHYKSIAEAAKARGETGALKFLSDGEGIKMMDGDMADSAEFKVMLRKYPKEDLLLYYIMERLVIPYLNGAYGNPPFEQLYAKAIKNWFADEGFPLSKSERTLGYFKSLYKSRIGHDFALTMNADVEKFDYINGGDCKYCALGRSSKMVRDSTLLSKIDKALQRNDRVIVTFGQGHALAIEPALRQLVAEFGK